MCECWLLYLLFMGTLSFVFCIYGSHYSHTAWRRPIFMENSCFCKRIKSKIICSPDLIFGLAEHLVTLTLYTALSLYHLEEMCHPDLILWPALLFGTWECIYLHEACTDTVWHSDTKCGHRSGSALAPVMACCLTAPSQYLSHVHLSSKMFCKNNFTWKDHELNQ